MHSPYQRQFQLTQQRTQKNNPERDAALIEAFGKELLSRIQYLKYEPQTILSLGINQSIDTALLQSHWKNASITALDYSPTLSLRAHSIDLIFANALLPFLLDYATLWDECLRLLKPGGVLLFSGLGPLSFQELKMSLAAFDKAESVNTFIDMHDVGDSLVQAGFQDPAIDSEIAHLHYSSVKRLLHELKHLGSTKQWSAYPDTLYYGKNFWRNVENYYGTHFSHDGKLVATIEAYFGIAFAPKQQTMKDGSVSIPISSIRL